MDITFASLLTAAGAITAGVIVTTLVEIIKTAIPVVDARVSGATLAFAVSLALFAVAGVALSPLTPDTGLQLFVSWLNVAAVAIGIKAVTTHVQLLPAKSAPITDVIVDEMPTDVPPADEPPTAGPTP